MLVYIQSTHYIPLIDFNEIGKEYLIYFNRETEDNPTFQGLSSATTLFKLKMRRETYVLERFIVENMCNFEPLKYQNIEYMVICKPKVGLGRIWISCRMVYIRPDYPACLAGYTG